MIKAYNCNLSGPPVDLGEVDKAGALALIGERWPFADVVFEDAEEAVARTMFGFSRSDQDFIEINLASVNLVTVRHEMRSAGVLSWLFGPRPYLVELNGRLALEALVTAYATSTEQCMEIMRSYPNKATR
ncbi:hypothetical protein M2333_001686 [Sphingobium sp. B11D3B]|nr:hypothetical protein [Sphingobium sp. B11D3B]MCW2388640.1 hypothetical protein [Sphingobium sp. B11D3B]